jgi:hypothetical protein
LVGSLRYAARRSGLASGLALVALVFRRKITEEDLATTDEVSAFRWAVDAEVAELADEAYAVGVLHPLDSDRPAAVRHHGGVHLIEPPPLSRTADRRPAPAAGDSPVTRGNQACHALTPVVGPATIASHGAGFPEFRAMLPEVGLVPHALSAVTRASSSHRA